MASTDTERPAPHAHSEAIFKNWSPAAIKSTLLAKAREVIDGDEAEPLTPAERSRRYRNRKKAERDGERVLPLFQAK
jgi:hypothetical protein